MAIILIIVGIMTATTATYGVIDGAPKDQDMRVVIDE